MAKNFSIILVGIGGTGVIRASNIIGQAVLINDNTMNIRTAETHGMAQRGGTVIVHLQFGPSVESPLIRTGSADILISFELIESIRYLHFLKPNGILLVNNELMIPPIIFRGQFVQINPELCIGCGNCRVNCNVNQYYRNCGSLAVISSPVSKISNGICQILDGCTGCRSCIAVCSQNAIQPMDKLICPRTVDITDTLRSYSKNSFIIEATKIAENLGDIRMTNVVMLGALLAFDEVPLNSTSLKEALRKSFHPAVLERNIQALEAGKILVERMR